MIAKRQTQPHHSNGHSSQAPPDSKKVARRRKTCKLTLEKQAELCGMISAGCGLPDAADLAGCSERAIRKLAATDPAFAARFRSALARQELVPLRKILKTSEARRRAAARYLSQPKPYDQADDQRETVGPELLQAWSEALGNALALSLDSPSSLKKLVHFFSTMFPEAAAHHMITLP